MSRLALSLVLLGALAPAAHAEGNRSLGVAVSPGAFAVTRMDVGVMAGVSGGLDWDFRRPGDWMSMGGHVASSSLFTEATPLRVRFGRVGPHFFPFVGVGLSLLLPWDPAALPTAPPLRWGGELSAGATYELASSLFLSAEARYQNFSLKLDPLSSARQELVSGYLGLGFRL